MLEGNTRVWGVSALVQAVGETLLTRFGQCVVKGEISGFTRAASGHGYFTLKDEQGGASLRCAMFRRAFGQLDFAPRDGLVVEVRGQLSVYEARGELQMVVDGMRQGGAGALYEQFLRMKARLQAEGLFDSERKRAIPPFPRQVAVVTSLGAAALRDVLTALRRRAPYVKVVLAPCLVQGSEAPAQIVRALADVVLSQAQTGPIDAILLCRGGGSLEDLWSFNDERVVRAVAQCPVPVVCGVGHETDITLCDFAADLRAPTPTAAAELAARAQHQALGELAGLEQAMGHRLQQRLDRQAQRLDQAGMRLSRMAQATTRHRQALDMLALRANGAIQRQQALRAQTLPRWQAQLQRACQQVLQRDARGLEALQSRLHALDPQRVLERGYAWLSDEQGRPVTQAAQAEVGQSLSAVLADGHLQVTVRQAAPRPPSKLPQQP